MSQQNQPSDEIFYASGYSSVWKQIGFFWGMALLGWLPLFPRTGVCNDDVAILVTTGIVFGLILVGVTFWLWIQSPGSGQPIVILRADALESSLIEGKNKYIRWLDIEQVVQLSSSAIEFRQSPTSTRPVVEDVWYGGDDSRPVITLDALSPADQTRLLNSIEQRLRAYNPNARIPTISLASQFNAAHRISERLEALAPTPWLTYTFALFIISVWAFIVRNGAFPFSISPELLLEFGGNATSQVLKGEWWRLATAIFLHSSIPHMATNVIALLFLGPTAERLYGRPLFILIYFGSGLVGSAMSLHFGAQTAVAIGASGAILGIGGAAFIGVLRNMSRTPQLQVFELLGISAALVWASVFSGFVRGNVDNAAHLGGLVAGCVLAAMLPDRFGANSIGERIQGRAWMGIAGIVFIVCGSVFAVKNSPVDLQSALTGGSRLERLVQELGSTRQLIRRDLVRVENGSLTATEAFGVGQRIYVPTLNRLLSDLDNVALLPDDPNAYFVIEVQYMANLMLGILATPLPGPNPQSNVMPTNSRLVTDSISAIDKSWDRINDGYGKLKSYHDAQKRPKCLSDR